MKKIVFTLITVFALALLAGNTKAQTSQTPYQGGTYSYTVNGIVVANASTATVTYSGDDVTLPSPIAVATTANSITFDVVYGAAATSGTLTVTIKDLTSECSNLINLSITVTNAPTLELAVTSVADFCQNLNGSPNNNEPADIGAAANTFLFTVTPTISAGAVDAGAKYAFDFDLNDYVIGASTAITIVRTSGDGTATPSTAGSGQIAITGATNTQTFTVSFATTTGVASETITGTVSGAVLTSGGSGSTTYTGTYSPASKDVVVKAMPAIGSFTGL